MSDSPMVSFLVPIYNVERYLEECLDSAVSQTLKEGYRTVDIAGGALSAVGCRRMGELVAERI